MLTPNQISPTQTSSISTSGTQHAQLNKLFKGIASVNSQQQLTLPLSPTPTNQNAIIQGQVTLKQAQLLQQQQVLVVFIQQQANLFLPSQQTQIKLTLSPELTQRLQAWLQKNSSDKHNQNLPKSIVELLAEKSNISLAQLRHQLLSVQLQQQTLIVHMLHGGPAAEIKGLSQPTNSAPESLSQLSQLLQFVLPVPLNDESFLKVQQQTSNSNLNSQEAHYRFTLQFELEKLGRLSVEVSLKGFNLETQCLCSSRPLQKQVITHWPLFEQRLQKLGFQTNNQTRLVEPETLSSAIKTSLIDIKV